MNMMINNPSFSKYCSILDTAEFFNSLGYKRT